MKKSDLKDGMVVEFRNGKRYMFISEIDLFVGNEIGVNFQDVEFQDLGGYSIVKVFKPIKNGCFSDILSKSHELIWEHKEVEKETLTQDQHDKLKALLLLGFSWIARDKDGEIYAYDSIPFKGDADWFNRGDNIRLKKLDLPFIKWEESAPRSIEDLLKLEIK